MTKQHFKALLIETYVCPECGQKMYVPRKRRRERGHIKDMWCIHCEAMMKFTRKEDVDADRYYDSISTGDEEEPPPDHH